MYKSEHVAYETRVFPRKFTCFTRHGLIGGLLTCVRRDLSIHLRIDPIVVNGVNVFYKQQYDSLNVKHRLMFTSRNGIFELLRTDENCLRQRAFGNVLDPAGGGRRATFETIKMKNIAYFFTSPRSFNPNYVVGIFGTSFKRCRNLTSFNSAFGPWVL